MAYHVASDEEVLAAARRVLQEAKSVVSQREFRRLVLLDIRGDDADAAVGGERLRRLMAQQDFARVEMRARKGPREKILHRCPVCDASLQRQKNQTLFGGEVTLTLRCPRCAYWTGKEKRISFMRFAVALLIGALIVAVTGGSAGVSAEPSAGLRDNGGGSCGVKLVLKNPDLQEQTDGLIHASGWFFIQFQAVGAGADRVKSFTFSFGKPAPDAAVKCDVAANQHFTGAYVLNYRGDYTPQDGFFVPINTTLVQDGEYGAAVHAYDQANAQGTEVGRFYVKAMVENGCAQPQCADQTTPNIIKKDKVLPWPRILPGDGVQTNAVGGLTIEFAESVRDVQAFINANETALTPWEGVPMDDDAQPGNDNTPCASQPAQVCKKRVWGPAFNWQGEIQQNDVIRVVATDQNNNRVEKILHLLDPTQGGIVTGETVDLSISVENSTVRTGPRQDAEFRFKFISLSSTDAHVNLAFKSYDESQIVAKWEPAHVVVKPGERAQASLIVSGKPGVDSGSFPIDTTASWRSGGQDVVRETRVSLVIGSGENVVRATGNATGNITAAPNADVGDTPAAGIVVTAILLAGAAWAVRSRRSSG